MKRTHSRIAINRMVRLERENGQKVLCVRWKLVAVSFILSKPMKSSYIVITQTYYDKEKCQTPPPPPFP